MLKLLLVDDERHTRNFIANALPWQDLGIDVVEQAENGDAALKLSLQIQPDIIVSDIRMPIMDGIELAEKIRDLFPNCKIIFISAYSDKKYLKSAITLKAANYVEKPIDLKELEEAIRTAVSECINSADSVNRELLTNLRLLENIPVLKADIANELCAKCENYDGLIKRLEYIFGEFLENKCYITAIISIKQKISNNKTDADVFSMLAKDTIEAFLSGSKVLSLMTIKENDVIVAHLSKEGCDSTRSLLNDIKLVAEDMVLILKNDFDLFICLGKPVKGIPDIYGSYQQAVLCTQSLFFKGFNFVQSYSEAQIKGYEFDDKLIFTFTQLLEESKSDECIELVRSLTKALKSKNNVLVNNVKNFYFNFFQSILEVSSKNNIDLFFEEGGNVMIWDTLLKISTLQELESFLIEKLQALDRYLYEKNAYSQITYEIINHIKKSYTDINLSVKSISNDLFMNKAYLCVVFKKDTGKTINQFLIEYRIQKSTELLKERRIKMIDVAEKVGFIDPNYYAKVFKKIKGINPSIYREKY